MLQGLCRGSVGRQVDGADQWRLTTNDVRLSEAEIQAGVRSSVPIGARVGPVGLSPSETASSSWTGPQRQETAVNNAYSGDRARREHSEVDQGSRDQQNAITTDVAAKGAEIYHDLGERNAAAQLAAGEASAGAAWQGYSIQVGALAEGRILNDRAAQTEFDSKVKALDVIEHAGVEAAKLRAEAAIVRTLGDQFANRVEEAAEQQRL